MSEEEKKGRNRRNSEEEPQEETSLGKEILSWLQIIVAAVVIAFVLNNFVIANSRIPTGSMENTIMSHSRVIGSRLSYIKDDPERGDIVIFRYPDNEKVSSWFHKCCLKRKSILCKESHWTSRRDR